MSTETTTEVDDTATEVDVDTEVDDTATEVADATEVDDDDQEDGDNAEDQEDAEPADDAETFPRKYVEKLRRENQKYRDQAATADTLAQRLHTALVAATGKLADPSDLDFDTAHLDDEDTLTAAIDTLIERKPHLRSRRPFGDIGQGASRSGETVDLAGLLRGRA